MKSLNKRITSTHFVGRFKEKFMISKAVMKKFLELFFVLHFKGFLLFRQLYSLLISNEYV